LPGGQLALAGAADTVSAVAMVRPETIRIVGEGDASLRGAIDSISFIGDRQRIVVSGASDKLLVIDAPNQTVVTIGDHVGLSIAPEAVRLLPREG
jgi:putative spermidine/putrescine transport system ATP-binding protein